MKGQGSRVVLAVVAALVVATAPRLAQANSFSPWPAFQHDPLHSGVTADTSVGASNASALALKWRTLVGGSGKKPPNVATSPAIVYNQTLGKTLAYVGSEGSTSSALVAVDTASGAVVWKYSVSTKIWASPAVDSNTVYFAGRNTLYALNATTGKLQCSFNARGDIFSSPTVAAVDTTGPVVFFGDTGTSESQNAGHEWAINGVGNTAGNCTKKWVFNAFLNKGANGSNTGVWSPAAVASDASGRQLVVFGSSQPDDAVYALKAKTGAEVWRFQTAVLGSDDDVGAGPTIGAPGVNGFSGGVVYLDGKDTIEYAVSLLTGKEVWEFNMGADSGIVVNCQSTAALVGGLVIVPEGPYLYALNAVSGTRTWRTAAASSDYLSSPAVSGGSGNQVAFIGDLSGVEHGYRVSDGTEVFSDTAGTSITSSAAEAGGLVLLGSNDDRLYAFG